MARPAERTIKKLFALSGNRCAFPDCSIRIVDESGVVTGEICHIRANNPQGCRFDNTQTDEGRQSYSNLILLCRHHHKIIDDAPDIYTDEILQDMKRIHESEFGRGEQATDTLFAKIILRDSGRVTVGDNSGNVAINSPGSIQAREIHLRTSRRVISVNAPPGTIGADQQSSRYVQYLVNRYNEFARTERTRGTKFNFGAISKNIEHNFGAQWKLLPLERFDELCSYLQARIGKTRVAKSNGARGWRAYSGFDEFLEK